MRRLLIPVALAAQAVGGLRWILLPIKDPQDRLRSGYCWGWLDPEMESRWNMLATAKGFHGHYEALKNLVSEWNRFDRYGSPGQRGAKVMLAWMTLFALGCLLAGFALGRFLA